MYSLSKSKILSFRQCEKKLWLEVHHKELATDSANSQKNFDVGNAVGDISREIYDPLSVGTLIDPFKSGFAQAFKQTQDLLPLRKPIFEAAFSIDGSLVLADILLPTAEQNSWRMVEIKSSTSVKDYHLDDVAIQYYVAKESGLELDSIALGHIDNQWAYQGDGNYEGLITEVDLTDHAVSMGLKVKEWFKAAQGVASLKSEPKVEIGPQCSKPFDCPFFEYCSKDLPKTEFPVTWLPRIQAKALKGYIQDNSVIEMADVPDELLNEKQLRVKHHTLLDSVYFDQEASNAALKPHTYPQYYLDFETINLAIPKWKGTRAYQQVPFQFSLHSLENPALDLEHVEFLDLSGKDPSYPFAEALIKTCGKIGPIYVYNIGFESARIKELAARFSDLSEDLLLINERLVDLWPIAKDHFYHPRQKGSWSIKAVLPAMAPEYNYDDLEGVKDGGMAMDAYAKAIDEGTSSEEKKTIEKQLLSYCELDTLAMVEVHSYLTIGPISGDKTLLEIVNKETFTLEEFRDYFVELSNDTEEYRNGFDKAGMIAGRLFDENEERCLSIMYRAKSLSKLVEKDRLPGWAVPKGTHQANVRLSILYAAGTCVMEEEEGVLQFEPDLLLAQALQHAKQN